MEHQQHLEEFDLAVIVLVAPTNDIDDLRPLISTVKDMLATIGAGEINYVR